MGKLPSSNFNLVFPSEQYVNDSFEGPAGARCLCFSKNIYEKDTFPKEILSKFELKVNTEYAFGIIPHLKTIILSDKDY